jgi:hypothetical protein
MSKTGSASAFLFGNVISDQQLRRRPQSLLDLSRAVDLSSVKAAPPKGGS